MGITGITEWIPPIKRISMVIIILHVLDAKFYIIIHPSITRKTGGALAKLFWLVFIKTRTALTIVDKSCHVNALTDCV